MTLKTDLYRYMNEVLITKFTCLLVQLCLPKYKYLKFICVTVVEDTLENSEVFNHHIFIL